MKEVGCTFCLEFPDKLYTIKGMPCITMYICEKCKVNIEACRGAKITVVEEEGNDI